MPDLQPDFNLSIGGRLLTVEQKSAIGDLVFEESVSSGRASVLTFTIRQTEAFDLEDSLISMEATVELELGYVGRTWKYFVGVVVDLSADMGDDVPELKIECHDLSYRLKSYGIEPIVVSGRTWKEVFEAIAATFEMRTFLVDPPDALTVETSKDQSVILGGISKSRVTLNVDSETFESDQSDMGDTPWQALDKIARRFGLKLLVRFDALLVVRQDFHAQRQSRHFHLVYDWRHKVNRSDTIRPLRDLRIKSSIQGKNNSVKAEFWSPVLPNGENRKTDAFGDNAELRAIPDANGPSGFVTAGGAVGPVPIFVLGNEDKAALSRQILAGALGLRSFFDWLLTPRGEFDLAGSLPQGGLSIGAGDVTLVEDISALIQSIDMSDPLKVERYIDRLKIDLSTSQREHLRDEIERKTGQSNYLFEDERQAPIQGPMPLSVNEPTKKVSGQGNKSEQQARLSALAKQRAIYERLTTASAEGDWMPEIRAGHKHELIVDALGRHGRANSGIYLVETVRHRINDSAAITEITLTRPYFQSLMWQGTIKL